MKDQGKHIIELRALEPEDIDLLFKWENNRDIWVISNTIAPFSKFVLTKYIESSHLDIYQTRQLRLMIDVKENDYVHTVGAVDLFDYDPQNNRVGIGILIANKEDRNKGYASDALEQLMIYLKDILHLHQAYCNILVTNSVSLALFSKHGFTQVGIKKEWVKVKAETYVDELLLQKIL